MSMQELLDFIDDSPVMEVVMFNSQRKKLDEPVKIALEGVDGCGKTTYAKKLFDNFSADRPAILVHSYAGRPWFDSWQDAISKLIVNNKTVDIVFDRTWSCEFVYAKFFGNRPPPLTHVRKLDTLALKHCGIVLMSEKDELETYYERLDEKDKEQFTIEDLKYFQKRYEKIWKHR